MYFVCISAALRSFAPTPSTTLAPLRPCVSASLSPPPVLELALAAAAHTSPLPQLIALPPTPLLASCKPCPPQLHLLLRLRCALVSRPTFVPLRPSPRPPSVLLRRCVSDALASRPSFVLLRPSPRPPFVLLRSVRLPFVLLRPLYRPLVVLMAFVSRPPFVPLRLFLDRLFPLCTLVLGRPSFSSAPPIDRSLILCALASRPLAPPPSRSSSLFPPPLSLPLVSIIPLTRARACTCARA